MSYDYRSRDWNLTHEDALKQLQKKYDLRYDIPILAHPENEAFLLNELGGLSVAVDVKAIDIDRYTGWCKRYEDRFHDWYPSNRREKILEYYVGYSLLDLQPGEIFLDMAAEISPNAQIFSEASGCRSYSQDIMYAPGINGNKIGAPCSALPMPDNYVNGAILACSFEHFEGDEDVKTIEELHRVLVPDGVFVIAPLYLNYDWAYYRTDPIFAISGDVEFPEYTVVYADQKFNNRFERVYNSQSLKKRIIEPFLDRFLFRVVYFYNYKDVDKSVYCNFALVGHKWNKG